MCSGNICRSPMGEVILRRLLDEARLGHVVVTSGGTG
ncbi:MAG: low molecular weight phosphotyrosine protein phosphatase, partial [Dermatophilaceae bacterium]